MTVSNIISQNRAGRKINGSLEEKDSGQSPPIYPAIGNLLNFDFGKDYSQIAFQNYKNGHPLLGTVNLLDSASELVLDFAAAMIGSACLGAGIAATEALLSTGSVASAYASWQVDLKTNLGIEYSKIQKGISTLWENLSISGKKGLTTVKKLFGNSKNIPLNRICNNPKDDIFLRGYNYSSISYQKKFYSQNGKFDNSDEPFVVYDIGSGNYMLQNGHHRFKAAQELCLDSIKVDTIIPYSESIDLGVTELQKNLIPKE